MNYSVEEWCALFELGGILQTLGVTLTRFAEDPTAKERYLVRAMGVFRRAVETVHDVNSEQDAEMIAKAAFAGRSLAQLLNDAAMEDFFSEAIQRVVSKDLYGDTIDRQEASEMQSILNMLQPSDQGASRLSTLSPMKTLSYVEQLVDCTIDRMADDRRIHVEDDVRKMAYFEKENWLTVDIFYLFRTFAAKSRDGLCLNELCHRL